MTAWGGGVPRPISVSSTTFQLLPCWNQTTPEVPGNSATAAAQSDESRETQAWSNARAVFAYGVRGLDRKLDFSSPASAVVPPGRGARQRRGR